MNSANTLAHPGQVATTPDDVKAGRRARTRRGTAAAVVDPSAPSFAYRRAYASLVLPDRAPPTIAITSAVRGEGRTTVSLGLARTIALDSAEMRVVLVEADPERPALSSRLGLPAGPGLADILCGRTSAHAALASLGDNLWVIPVGDDTAEAPRLLRQLADGRLVIGPDLADLVILDLPPVMTDAYAPLIATAAGVTLLVVRGASTPHKVVRAAVDRFDGVLPQGIILNAPRTALPRWWPNRGV